MALWLPARLFSLRAYGRLWLLWLWRYCEVFPKKGDDFPGADLSDLVAMPSSESRQDPIALLLGLEQYGIKLGLANIR